MTKKKKALVYHHSNAPIHSEAEFSRKYWGIILSSTIGARVMRSYFSFLWEKKEEKKRKISNKCAYDGLITREDCNYSCSHMHLCSTWEAAQSTQYFRKSIIHERSGEWSLELWRVFTLVQIFLASCSYTRYTSQNNSVVFSKNTSFIAWKIENTSKFLR